MFSKTMKISKFLLFWLCASFATMSESRYHYTTRVRNANASAARVKCLEHSTDSLNAMLIKAAMKWDYPEPAGMKSSQLSKLERYMSVVLLDGLGHLFEETECLQPSSGPVQYKLNKSTCPWRAVTTTDETRWPRSLFTAKCTCSGCNSLPGDVKLEKRMYRCMPIQRQMLVLKKGRGCDARGFYKWHEALEDINLGCTCGLMSELNPQ
jgi:hypothetical protein